MSADDVTRTEFDTIVQRAQELIDTGVISHMRLEGRIPDWAPPSGVPRPRVSIKTKQIDELLKTVTEKIDTLIVHELCVGILFALIILYASFTLINLQ